MNKRPEVNRRALELVALQLDNLSVNYGRMAARAEVKAEKIDPSELDAVADSMARLRKEILAALGD